MHTLNGQRVTGNHSNRTAGEASDLDGATTILSDQETNDRS